mgnify:CR=1 FL=1
MKFKFRADKKDIVIFLIFCFILLYFVCIGVANIHGISTNQALTGFNPFLAFTPELFLSTILIYLFILISILKKCFGLERITYRKMESQIAFQVRI